MDSVERAFRNAADSQPLCHWCDEDASWIVDQECNFGGGEDGPEYDAPVLCFACDSCKDKSAYMLPVRL